MISENFKEKSFNIDIDALLKKTIEGKNLSVLFETELQKKFIDPLFKKISDTVIETKIDVAPTNLTGLIDDAFSTITLDKNAASRLNTAFSDKINNIITNINGINIENIRKDFEQNIDIQFKEKFNSVKLDVPEKLKTKKLLNLLTENDKDSNALTKYKLLGSAIELVDKISASVKNFNIDIKKNLKIKDLVDLLISPNKNFNILAKDRYVNIINNFLDTLDKGAQSFKIDSTPLTSNDIFSILFEKDTDTVSFTKKRYEETLNTLAEKILTVDKISAENNESNSLQRNSDFVDNLADYSSNTRDAIFSIKEFSLSADTLKQIKIDNSFNLKDNDLATNTAQDINTKKLLLSFEEMKVLLEDLNDSVSTKSNTSNTSSVSDLIKNIFTKPSKTQDSKSSQRQQNQRVSQNNSQRRSQQLTTKPQTSRNNTRPSAQRSTPTPKSPRRASQTRATTSQPSAKSAALKPKATSIAKASRALKAASAIGTVASIGISAYNYNEVDKMQKQNLVTKQEAITEKSKIVGEATGGLAGAAAGAYTGAALGSLVGPIGTLIGGVIGGIAGSIGGSSLGEKAGEKVASTYLLPKVDNITPTPRPLAPEEERVNLLEKNNTKEPSVNITQPVTQNTQPVLPSNIIPAPVSSLALEPPATPLETLKITAIENDRQTENFTEAAAADFAPLMSFLDKKFEILSTGMIALAQAIGTSSSQPPINIINNQQDQTEEFTMQSTNSYEENQNFVNVIEATRAAYRSL